MIRSTNLAHENHHRFCRLHKESALPRGILTAVDRSRFTAVLLVRPSNRARQTHNALLPPTEHVFFLSDAQRRLPDLFPAFVTSSTVHAYPLITILFWFFFASFNSSENSCGKSGDKLVSLGAHTGAKVLLAVWQPDARAIHRAATGKDRQKRESTADARTSERFVSHGLRAHRRARVFQKRSDSRHKAQPSHQFTSRPARRGPFSPSPGNYAGEFFLLLSMTPPSPS